MPSEPMLEVRNLTVTYGEAVALDGVDLTVQNDEIVGLIGPNGAGKTTFADAVAGHKEYHEGEIFYEGEEIKSSTPTSLTEQKLIYCTERRDLFRYMSVEENLVLGAYTNRDQLDERRELAFSIFPVLEERRDQEARTLSGGEQQMLALARSLMADPELLLIDEPTLGLAPVIIDDISEAISDLREDMALLICEQNVTFTLRHADRIYLIENGRIELEASPEEIRENEYVSDVYIGA